jgi:transcriptional regulator with XRE-family HTH domain/mannose-6-phosphate isomerase-like protein (cupin superfamily)
MQLGPVLRLERRKRGLTLAELAAASGLSKGFVSQIENDKTSPSLDTLERLAGALDLRVVDLLRGAADPAPAPHVAPRALEPTDPAAPRHAGPRRLLDPPAPPTGPSVREVSPPGALLRSFVVELPPGATLGEPGHQHAGEESVAMLAGIVDADQAGGVTRLYRGDVLAWTPGQPHRLLNRSPEPARLLITLVAPAALGALGVVGSPRRGVAAPPPERSLRLVQMRAARDRLRATTPGAEPAARTRQG